MDQADKDPGPDKGGEGDAASPFAGARRGDARDREREAEQLFDSPKRRETEAAQAERRKAERRPDGGSDPGLAATLVNRMPPD